MIVWCRNSSGHGLVHCRAINHLNLVQGSAVKCPHLSHSCGAPNMNCHPFIADGSLFELCGIHKKMIAWCRSSSGHGLVHCQAINHLKSGGFFGTAQRPFVDLEQLLGAPNMDWHPFIADGSLFELCGIHKKMIAWCRSSSGHGLVHIAKP